MTSSSEFHRIWREKSDADLATAAARLADFTEEGERAVRDELRRRGMPDPPPVRRVRARLPAPAFADSTWVHALIGAPVGASLAFVLQPPPRGSLEHLIVGAVAGAMFGAVLGTLRPQPFHSPPDDTPAYEPAPDEYAVVPTRHEDRSLTAPASVELGQTKDQVELQLGPPETIVNLPDKTIYVYEHLKIIFVDGKVADVE